MTEEQSSLSNSQLVLWNKLFQLLQTALDESLSLHIQDSSVDGDIIIMTLVRTDSGCGNCKCVYDSFEISGILFDEWNPQGIKFSADVSQYEMHNCPKKPSEGYCKDFSPLLKGYIERKEAYLLNLFLDLDDLTSQVSKAHTLHPFSGISCIVIDQ
jgi:hypothetical protein